MAKTTQSNSLLKTMFHSTFIVLFAFMYVSPGEQTRAPLLLATTTCTDQEPWIYYWATIYLSKDEINLERLSKRWVAQWPNNEPFCLKETFAYRYHDKKLVQTKTDSEKLPAEMYDTLGATFHRRHNTCAQELKHNFGSSMRPRTPEASHANACSNCAIYDGKLGLIATYAAPGIVSLYTTKVDEIALHIDKALQKSQ